MRHRFHVLLSEQSQPNNMLFVKHLRYILESELRIHLDLAKVSSNMCSDSHFSVILYFVFRRLQLFLLFKAEEKGQGYS